MNGGNPTIEKQGAYALYDLWTWKGWISTFTFYMVRETLLEMFFATLVGIGMAFVYALASDLPLCVAGDITYKIPFSSEELDICTFL